MHKCENIIQVRTDRNHRMNIRTHSLQTQVVHRRQKKNSVTSFVPALFYNRSCVMMNARELLGA